MRLKFEITGPGSCPTEKSLGLQFWPRDLNISEKFGISHVWQRLDSLGIIVGNPYPFEEKLSIGKHSWWRWWGWGGESNNED